MRVGVLIAIALAVAAGRAAAQEKQVIRMPGSLEGLPFSSAVRVNDLLFLSADGHDLLDLGTFSSEPVDYPDFARSVGQAVLRGFAGLGVLVCGSGVGASIAANKLRGIRAALCGETFTARQSREDDDANVLCLGARVLDEARAIEIARAWLAARFSADERHVRRLAKISQLEEGAQAAAPRARSAPPSRGIPAPATPPPSHPLSPRHPPPRGRPGASRDADQRLRPPGDREPAGAGTSGDPRRAGAALRARGRWLCPS